MSMGKDPTPPRVDHGECPIDRVVATFQDDRCDQDAGSNLTPYSGSEVFAQPEKAHEETGP